MSAPFISSGMVDNNMIEKWPPQATTESIPRGALFMKKGGPLRLPATVILRGWWISSLNSTVFSTLYTKQGGVSVYVCVCVCVLQIEVDYYCVKIVASQNTIIIIISKSILTKNKNYKIHARLVARKRTNGGSRVFIF